MPASNTFNLLALGHRGAGKTVFLAGSYAASRPAPGLSRAWQLWFDCQSIKAQQHLEQLLQIVARTSQYPPPTLKVTAFTFRLQRRSLMGVQTLCRFQWSDVPGEICSLRNPQFQALLLKSHAGCLFIDAQALAKHGRFYLETLESLIRQTELISAYVDHRGLRYPFALILTKCDRVSSDPHGLRHLQHHLMPLLTRLNNAQVYYRTFYSAIPIITTTGMAALQTRRAALPFLWLTSELRQQHRTHPPEILAHHLQDLFDRINPSTVSRSAAITQNRRRHRPPPIARWLYFCGWGGLAVLLLGVGFSWIAEGQKTRQRQPQTLNTEHQIVKLLNNHSMTLARMDGHGLTGRTAGLHKFPGSGISSLCRSAGP